MATFPRLRITRFRLQKEQELTIDFHAGLNILTGKNQIYRTAIFRMLQYAWGGEESRISDDELRKSEIAEIVLTANDEELIVQRSTQHPSAKLTVFQGERKYQYEKKEMSDLFLDLLGMPKIVRQVEREGNIIESPLSFYQLSRAFVVDRDISYSGIMTKVTGPEIRDIVDVIFGITTREIADAENSRRRLTRERNELGKQITTINDFLKDLLILSTIEIDATRRELVADLDRLASEEQRIRDSVSRETNIDTPIYQELRQELIQNRAALEDLHREDQNLSRQLTIKAELRESVDDEIGKMSRHLISKHVISTYSFTQCPRCNQEITPEMRSKEAEGNCMLCGRHFTVSHGDLTSWRKSIKDSEQLTKEIDELTESYTSRRAVIKNQFDLLEKRVTEIENQLNRETQSYISPVVEEISLSRTRQIEIQKRLSELDYMEQQRVYSNKLRDEKLPEAEAALEKVEKELDGLKIQSVSAAAARSAFMSHFREFLEVVRPIHDFSEISWDSQSNLPKIDNMIHTKFASGADLALVILGFHFSLLKMSLVSPGINTNHPKILLIDEPEQQKMGSDKGRAILKVLASLAEDYRDRLQIIVTTSERELSEDLHEFEVPL